LVGGFAPNHAVLPTWRPEGHELIAPLGLMNR
jgi:hypothetical protein